jgi:hypothetical protein
MDKTETEEAAWKGGCGQDWPPHIADSKTSMAGLSKAAA